jgi:CheY-like chemotaxis protein
MPHLLYVEDNDADITIVRDALKAVGVPAELHVVGNGMEAFDFLARRGPYAGAPRPDLVLLDLNLPLMSGLLMLAQLRRDPAWTDLPVVIYTSSKKEADRFESLKLRASFETKPNTWVDAISFAERLSAKLAQQRELAGPTKPRQDAPPT